MKLKKIRPRHGYGVYTPCLNLVANILNFDSGYLLKYNRILY